MNDDAQSALSAATAVCGAYLLVAFADARVEKVEEARFLAGVVNDIALREMAPEAIGAEYSRLLALLKTDYDAAEAEILRAVSRARRDLKAIEAIKLAARHAVIADQVIKPQEETAMARLARALDVPVEDF